MKIKDIICETPSAESTHSANVQIGVVGAHKGGKSYTGSPGKSGTKAPKQAKVVQPKTKNSTAKNALDMKGGKLLGGQGLLKRSQ